LSVNQKFSDNFTGTTTVAYTNSGGNRAQNGSNISGITLGLFRAPASFNLNNEEYGYKFPNGQQRMYYYVYDNPYFSAYENPLENEVNRIMGSINLNYSFTDWLSAAYKVGVDAYSDEREGAFAIGAMGNNYGEGEVYHNTITNEEFNSDIFLKSQYDFTDKISAALNLGGNVNQRTFSDFYSYARGLVLRDYYNLDNGSDKYSSEYASTIRTSALYFDFSASYDDFLFMGLTGRNEWSSTFGPNQNSFFYPSASLSLLFSELLPKNKILTFGKIRYAYAQVGKAPPVYSSKTYFGNPIMTDGFTDGVGFPYLGQNGYSYGTSLGDPSLKPERVIGNEIGIDLRFFNGRVNIDFTYYNQKTEDILLNRPIAGSSGFTSIYSNAGEMVNKGIELVAGVDILKTKKFNWNFTANFSKNESEVLKLADGVPEVSAESAFSSIGSYAIVGEAYGAFYGTLWARDNAGNIIINPNNGLPMKAANEGNLGNPFPDYQLGLRNTISYKGFSATALLDIREGGDVYYGTGRRLYTYGRAKETEDREGTFVVDGVLAETDGTGNIVRDENGDPVASGTVNGVEISAIDYYHSYLGDGGAVENAIKDGSWVRLREVAISYRFQNRDNKLPFGDYIEVSFTGTNLWLSTDYPGVDPETSLTGAGSNIGGFDYFNNPGSKTYSFGIKVGF
jgi:outer membrane receptor protein involved in Fe transport